MSNAKMSKTQEPTHQQLYAMQIGTFGLESITLDEQGCLTAVFMSHAGKITVFTGDEIADKYGLLRRSGFDLTVEALEEAYLDKLLKADRVTNPDEVREIIERAARERAEAAIREDDQWPPNRSE